MATPEKAFLDTLYLSSLGKYSLDEAALDMAKLDRKTLKKEASVFAPKIQDMIADYE